MTDQVLIFGLSQPFPARAATPTGNGLVIFEEAFDSTGENSTIPVASFTPLANSYPGVDVAITPIGNGSIMASIPGPSNLKRGPNSVDFQTIRDSPSIVAIGVSSVISGGG